MRRQEVREFAKALFYSTVSSFTRVENLRRTTHKRLKKKKKTSSPTTTYQIRPKMRLHALQLLSVLNLHAILLVSADLLDYISEFGLKKGWPYVKEPFPKSKVQSPTDIDLTNAKPCYYMPPIVFHRHADLPHEHVEIENTGYYLEILLNEKECKHKPYIVGGPLFGEPYVFEQMHFHWGKDDCCGSEHWINGKCHSTEVHMVFFNKKYESFKVATGFTDGVAVISFFGDISEEDNPDLVDLCQRLTEIQEPHTSTTGSFKDEFEFVNVLFQQDEYFTFPGSLTTEPYQECVTWIMYMNPFPISHNQLDAFRQLKHKDGQGMIRENDRPLQEFGDRPIVYPAFNKDFKVESHESDSMSEESVSSE